MKKINHKKIKTVRNITEELRNEIMMLVGYRYLHDAGLCECCDHD